MNKNNIINIGNDKGISEKEIKLVDEEKKRTKSREGEDRKNNNVIVFQRNYNRNSKSPGNNYNYIYNFSNNNNNHSYNNNLIQKKYQQQKKIKQQKYIEGLGLSDIYKIYSPSLDLNYGQNQNKKSFENNYIYHNRKPLNYYSKNNDYSSPKVIPNRRLNPINAKQMLRNIKL